MIVCAKCGSDDIQQEASIMLNPNTGEVPVVIHTTRLHWNDYYWCKKCDDEFLTNPCSAREAEEKK